VAALLSGLMSQISGALNSIATLASYDLYKRFKPQTTNTKLVKVGRWSAGIALLLSIGLLPLLNRYQSLFEGLNDIIAHIAPPITCVFILGVFWKRASARSAQYTLWFGSLIGGLAYTINKLFPDCITGHIPFMMMAFYLFCICLVMQISLSFIFPELQTLQSEKLYWTSIWEPLRTKGWKGVGNYKFLSITLLTVIAILYYIFR